MKQYMMAIYMVEGEPPPPAENGVDAFNEKLMAAGQWVFGDGFSPDTTKVISAEKGEVVTTDGPFAEAKEHLAGFWIIKARDQDAAQELAAEASVACGAPIELRAFEEEVPDQA